MNRIVERWSPVAWIGAGSLVSLGAGLAVVPLVGTPELVAGGVSLLAGVIGLGAGGWAQRLSHLPLTVAPVLAEWDGPAGRQLTVRAWLGRGRKLDRVSVQVEAEGRALVVLAPGGPVLGCFHAVFPAVDAPVTVTIRATSGRQTLCVEQVFAMDSRVPGRFRAGFSAKKGRWRWHRDRWDQVRRLESGTMR